MKLWYAPPGVSWQEVDLKALALAVWDRITNEPVLTLGIIQAALALAVGFGLGWTGEQVGLIVAFAAAILSFVARKQVTPTKNVPVVG